MADSAAVRLARELDDLSERHADDSEFVALCDRLLFFLGELERTKVRGPDGEAKGVEDD